MKRVSGLKLLKYNSINISIAHIYRMEKQYCDTYVQEKLQTKCGKTMVELTYLIYVINYTVKF